MNSTSFGPLTTPAGGGLLRPRLGVPRMKMGKGMGLGVPKLGGLELAKFADGGLVDHPSLTYLNTRDALHGMPNMALPDYMMARMAVGGNVSIDAGRRAMSSGFLPHAAGFPHYAGGGGVLDEFINAARRRQSIGRTVDEMSRRPGGMRAGERVGIGGLRERVRPDGSSSSFESEEGEAYRRRLDEIHNQAVQMLREKSGYAEGGEFEHPILRHFRERRAEQYRPRLRARYSDESDNPFYWNPSIVRGDEGRRAAEDDIRYAGERRMMEGRETRDMLHDMAGSMLDPTMAPLMFGGTTAKLLARAAPRLMRPMPSALPHIARAGEFGAWNTMPPNIGGASPDSEYDLPWSMR